MFYHRTLLFIVVLFLSALPVALCETTLIVTSNNPDPAHLATLSIRQRPEDVHGVYVSITYEYLANSTTDAFCYEGGTHFSSARVLSGGRLEMRHTVDSYPNIYLVTVITPEPNEAVEFLARYEAPRGQTIPAGLLVPDMCNICYKPSSAYLNSPPKGHLFYNVYDNSYPNAPYIGYVRRCFLYTRNEIGEVTDTISLGDTSRFPHPDIPPNDYRNDPWCWIQVYIGEWQAAARPDHQSWTSNDKYTKTVIGCKSVDNNYLLALASDTSPFLFQGWACMHNLPEWLPLNATPQERRWRLKVYLMPNDTDALINRATLDFPDLANQPYTPNPLNPTSTPRPTLTPNEPGTPSPTPTPTGPPIPTETPNPNPPLLKEDWNTGTIDSGKWKVGVQTTQGGGKAQLEQIRSGDYAFFTEGPRGASGSPGSDWRSFLYSKQAFPRGNNLRCTFKTWCDPTKNTNWVGGNPVYGAITGPWHSDIVSLPYNNPMAMIRYFNTIYFAQLGDTWPTGGVPTGTLFDEAFMATTSKANSLIIRVWLGDEKGAKCEWSKDGLRWNTITDNRGGAGGTGSAYLGWATYGCAVFIDDIAVETDLAEVLPEPNWTLY